MILHDVVVLFLSVCLYGVRCWFGVCFVGLFVLCWVCLDCGLFGWVDCLWCLFVYVFTWWFVGLVGLMFLTCVVVVVITLLVVWGCIVCFVCGVGIELLACVYLCLCFG